MQQRPVYQKMGMTTDDAILVVNGSSEAITAIALPIEPDTHPAEKKLYDYIILFVKTQHELDKEFPRYKEHIAPNGKLWASWPKAGKLGTDLNLKEVIRIGYSHGLVESTTLRVNDTWAAIKFTRPKPGKTYQNSYGQLPN